MIRSPEGCFRGLINRELKRLEEERSGSHNLFYHIFIYLFVCNKNPSSAIWWEDNLSTKTKFRSDVLELLPFTKSSDLEEGEYFSSL